MVVPRGGMAAIEMAGSSVVDRERVVGEPVLGELNERMWEVELDGYEPRLKG
jgi:hypothetical protein